VRTKEGCLPNVRLKLMVAPTSCVTHLPRRRTVSRSHGERWGSRGGERVRASPRLGAPLLAPPPPRHRRLRRAAARRLVARQRLQARHQRAHRRRRVPGHVPPHRVTERGVGSHGALANAQRPSR